MVLVQTKLNNIEDAVVSYIRAEKELKTKEAAIKYIIMNYKEMME